MLSYKEQRQYLKDDAHIQAEKDVLYMQEWQEWQHQMRQRPAKIVVVKEDDGKVSSVQVKETHKAEI